ncbi:hypothetical protein [Pseudoalteromonas luteoviolacea]|uniref:Uncharacterized protein n=1 Tax=Pseudoalteromonas luteoviolacea S4054 TaxID=1129367 RepID=A0A0F6ADH1_9GAMM|nr:hypothetical protein [Pseudoalteromonas luteoviolacea]AOT08333.1 hypothetical protein S4054249_10975 [Pseudoalteromonas luteoviolacea]AOT13249.1 hypothetical protein S40542_10950 [Pseudoalteromonas luteoviolacea]AOT18162.1 hypothetical protein S4054_10950 [Pseudoalteromonas luteoviolacea]KKE84277.1 hypothetical protein N479_10280 [Pseudoalteromonas luteoviolacea S4054]KZN76118.1 hypothetical protein N481_07135 [Pseudoalteromonas luteoviolacea S4047-1]
MILPNSLATLDINHLVKIFGQEFDDLRDNILIRIFAAHIRKEDLNVELPIVIDRTYTELYVDDDYYNDQQMLLNAFIELMNRNLEAISRVFGWEISRQSLTSQSTGEQHEYFLLVGSNMLECAGITDDYIQEWIKAENSPNNHAIGVWDEQGLMCIMDRLSEITLGLAMFKNQIDTTPVVPDEYMEYLLDPFHILPDACLPFFYPKECPKHRRYVTLQTGELALTPQYSPISNHPTIQEIAAHAYHR